MGYFSEVQIFANFAIWTAIVKISAEMAVIVKIFNPSNILFWMHMADYCVSN